MTFGMHFVLKLKHKENANLYLILGTAWKLFFF